MRKADELKDGGTGKGREERWREYCEGTEVKDGQQVHKPFYVSISVYDQRLAIHI